MPEQLVTWSRTFLPLLSISNAEDYFLLLSTIALAAVSLLDVQIGCSWLRLTNAVDHIREHVFFLERIVRPQRVRAIGRVKTVSGDLVW